jgi:hypothetical protein
MRSADARLGRLHDTAVWAASRMVVWGGMTSSYTNTGGVYNPVSDTWPTTSTTGAPTARTLHTAVWTGSTMIVWGGNAGGATNIGGIYENAALLSPRRRPTSTPLPPVA